MTTPDPAVLDSPARYALAARDSGLAVRAGAAARYRPDVSVFAATPEPDDAAAWADLASLVPAGGGVALADPVLPADWLALAEFHVLQMVDADVVAAAEGVVALGDADVPEMVDLVELTHPGPFEPRTIELGGYVGVREAGRLVAMAGERVHPPGWTEVSAVCTHPDHRGRGYGTRVLLAVVAGVHARGERAFLHVEVGNPARSAYERAGFRVHRQGVIVAATPRR